MLAPAIQTILILGIGSSAGASRVFVKHHHVESLNLTSQHLHGGGDWKDVRTGLCGCSDSIDLDESYVQFDDARQCAERCFGACWDWRAPEGASYSQVRPGCLAVYKGQTFVDEDRVYSEALKEGEEWTWKDAPMPDVPTMYLWGEASAKKRSPSFLSTWKGRAGVFTGRKVPDQDLPGNCMCANGYFIPFLDWTKKYPSVEKCHGNCQLHCQTFGHTIPTEVADEDHVEQGWCVGKDLTIQYFKMKTECRCWAKAVLTSDLKAVGSTKGMRGAITFYDSVEHCQPTRCKQVVKFPSRTTKYLLPTINPYSCFRGTCAGHCLEMLGGQLQRQPAAAECVDADGRGHYTIMSKRKEGRAEFRGLERVHYGVHDG